MPSAIFSPWSSTVTRSLMPITTFMSCSMSRTVRPSSVAQLADEVGQLAGLLGVHAGGRLVEQQQLRLGGQGAGDLEAALVAVRQVAGERLRAPVEADELEQLHGLVVRLGLLALDATAAAGSPPNQRPLSRWWRPTSTFSSAVMLPNSRMFWKVRADAEPDDLVGLAPGQLRAVERDLTLGRDVQAGDHVEERRLAGAVGPDEADDRRRAGS